MQTITSSAIQAIDASMLTPIVRQALHRDNFQILDWHTNQLGGGAGNPVSFGLYRFEGSGQDRDERVAWSVILKVIQSPANVGWENFGEGDDKTHWNYWKRELLVYQSGLLEKLPEGMAAPRCYGMAEFPDNVAWLWLEDIVDSHQDVWPLERYALTARHLGRLNGIHLSEHPLPTFPWFGIHRNLSWLDLMPWQTMPWDHPRALERYPKPEMNPFRRMLLENERVFAMLDTLPKTISHGDTYPTNFKSRLSNGHEQTIALDWALMGIAPLGDDLGQFVYGAQMNLKELSPADIDQTLFESYLDGLRDTNCKFDRQVIRFGYTASAALRVGLFQLYFLDMDIKQSKTVTDQSVENPVTSNCFEVTMADEAFNLLDLI